MCLCVSARAPLQAQAQPSAGSQWQFDDEDQQTPTWTETLRAQAVDLAVFAGFTVLALVSFFRKDKRMKYVTLVACVVLLGFWKSQLITIVNVFGVISLDLPIFRYSLAWYLLATFTVVSTVLWGRLYCGRMCAFGALTQLMDAALPASVAPRAAAMAGAARRVHQVRAARRRDPLLPRHTRPVDLPLHRAVLDVRLPRLAVMWSCSRRCSSRRSSCGISIAGSCVPSAPRSACCRGHDRVLDQAVEGMQHLQDLREDVRVGRDSRAEDRQERVRAVRRLRAALRGHQEVSALDHPAEGSEEGAAGRGRASN